MTPGPILSPADSDRVAAAVAAAEARANAEIVTVVTRASDSYADIALAWSALIAGVALLALTTATGFYLGLVDHGLGLWDHHWSPRDVFGLALFVGSVKFAGMWVILLWRRLRLILTPGPIKGSCPRGVRGLRLRGLLHLTITYSIPAACWRTPRALESCFV